MPKIKREFVNGEIYHIVLRRIGNELLFRDIDDYYRGVFCIYEFNTTQLITIRAQRRARAQFKKAIKKANRGQTPVSLVKMPATTMVFNDKRDRLVEVLVFCLMPNHIHLLLRQIKEGGISKFMQKFGSGYASYFKTKYKIKLRGHFFQDRFTHILVKTGNQLRAVFNYIHTNSVSLIEPEWKQGGINDPEKVIKFLEEYKWSSYQDYLGQKNFPSVTDREFMLEVMGGKEGCQRWVEDWIRYKAEARKLMKKFATLALE